MAPSCFVSRGTLLALLSITSSAHGTLNQHPLAEDAPKINDGPLYPSRDALMTTYLDPKYPCVPERNQPVVELDIPVNTCASANFTMDNNVLLEYPGLCEGGVRAPYLALFPSNDCTGDHVHPGWQLGGMGPGHCLSKSVWGLSPSLDPPVGQWSIMLRCDDNVSISETRDMVQISLPQRPPVVEKPEKPRPTSASVSDSACFIPELGMAGHPKFIFQRPGPDLCVNVAPWHQLKVYRSALCPDGTEAPLARWMGSDCTGESVNDEAADIGTECITMGEDYETSYAFVCTGDVRSGKVEQSLFPDDDGEQIHVHYSFGDPYQEVSVKSSAAGNRVWATSSVSLLVILILSLS
ncbi:hypothetical protein AK830_g1255 [Neonectria ditissima]|uniref:Uncharacterized protein n=1 Tax=Neonectria ditissima TaxID=78410 RepID=A0A0P7BJD4_9HYPO|nr:hypothetical protein AK830_g1255 [Neonectria ditissima]